MSEIHPELIEQYQLTLERDPKAKVFAPLAEAYRKMGLKKEALLICRAGVQHNPHFAGGRVALAKLLIEENQLEEASKELTLATELSPENIMAQNLLAESLLKLRRPKEALKAYKMVLLLNPNSEKAQKAVKKLESLTADEFDEELFAMRPLSQIAQARSFSPQAQEEQNTAPLLRPQGTEELELKAQRDLERLLSLADAYVVRNDMEKALAALREIERVHGRNPEVSKRIRLIDQRQEQSEEEHLPQRGSMGRQPKVTLEEAEVELPELTRQEQLRLRQVDYLRRVLSRLQNGQGR